jgi:hypothetical protein
MLAACMAVAAVAACHRPAIDHRREFTVADLQAARGFDWVRDSVGMFRLYAEAGTGPAGRLEAVVEEITGDIQPQIRSVIGRGISGEPIHVFLLEDTSDMKRLIGWAGTGIATETFVLHVLPEDRPRLGAHEFMHVATAREFGELTGYGSWMLNEGVAVFASGRWHGYDLHALTRRLRDEGDGLALRRLLTEGRSLAERITYPQAGSFVEFLHHRFGADTLAALLQRQYSSPEPQFEAVLGMDLEALEAEWNDVVSSADAGDTP